MRRLPPSQGSVMPAEPGRNKPKGKENHIINKDVIRLLRMEMKGMLGD